MDQHPEDRGASVRRTRTDRAVDEGTATADQRGEKWEKVGNWTQDKKRGRVSGVLSASLPLLTQERPYNQVITVARAHHHAVVRKIFVDVLNRRGPWTCRSEVGHEGISGEGHVVDPEGHAQQVAHVPVRGPPHQPVDQKLRARREGDVIIQQRFAVCAESS
eukprot:1179100-Prorocentrum_minimum.AAC.4